MSFKGTTETRLCHFCSFLAGKNVNDIILLLWRNLIISICLGLFTSVNIFWRVKRVCLKFCFANKIFVLNRLKCCRKPLRPLLCQKTEYTSYIDFRSGRCQSSTKNWRFEEWLNSSGESRPAFAWRRVVLHFFDPKQLLRVSCIWWCYLSKCY